MNTPHLQRFVAMPPGHDPPGGHPALADRHQPRGFIRLAVADYLRPWAAPPMTPSPDLVAAVEGMRRFGSYGMPLIKAIEDDFRKASSIATGRLAPGPHRARLPSLARRAAPPALVGATPSEWQATHPSSVNASPPLPEILELDKATGHHRAAEA
ncbi:hypothetical protein QJS66_22955 [Kocuria rhizophila]|nr:hypothetical protein QJS66_22955 [Kocuria rhizophila]